MEGGGGLQRSEISFRRSGSSGLIWDDKFLSGELKQVKTKEEEERETKGRQQQVYRTVEVEPTIDPPSPKASGCGLCGVFGKPVKSHRRKPGKAKS